MKTYITHIETEYFLHRISYMLDHLKSEIACSQDRLDYMREKDIPMFVVLLAEDQHSNLFKLSNKLVKFRNSFNSSIRAENVKMASHQVKRIDQIFREKWKEINDLHRHVEGLIKKY